MLKLYRPHAEQLLLAATYLRYRRSDSLEDVLGNLRNQVVNGGNNQTTLNNARKGIQMPPHGDHWLDSALNQLFQGLSDDANGRGESDLVDQIVRAVQLPFSRNVMSGEAMRRLRAAILLPSEQAGLTQRLRQREMSCGQCGIALHDRESVTITVDGGGTQSLACHRCIAPTSVPCASCTEVASLSSKAMNAMSRMQCPACQEAKKEKKHPEPHASEGSGGPPAPDRYTFAGNRTRGVATPIPTNLRGTANITSAWAPDLPGIAPDPHLPPAQTDIVRWATTAFQPAPGAALLEVEGG